MGWKIVPFTYTKSIYCHSGLNDEFSFVLSRFWLKTWDPGNMPCEKSETGSRTEWWGFCCSVTKLYMTLQSHGLQHTMLPCPSPTPGAYQTHVHWVSDAIQPSHPLLSPSPPAFNISQHQGLFQWVSLSHQVAKIWEFQLQHQLIQWIFRTDFL